MTWWQIIDVKWDLFATSKEGRGSKGQLKSIIGNTSAAVIAGGAGLDGAKVCLGLGEGVGVVVAEESSKGFASLLLLALLASLERGLLL